MCTEQLQSLMDAVVLYTLEKSSYIGNKSSKMYSFTSDLFSWSLFLLQVDVTFQSLWDFSYKYNPSDGR